MNARIAAINLFQVDLDTEQSPESFQQGSFTVVQGA